MLMCALLPVSWFHRVIGSQIRPRCCRNNRSFPDLSSRLEDLFWLIIICIQRDTLGKNWAFLFQASPSCLHLFFRPTGCSSTLVVRRIAKTFCCALRYEPITLTDAVITRCLQVCDAREISRLRPRRKARRSGKLVTILNCASWSKSFSPGWDGFCRQQTRFQPLLPAAAFGGAGELVRWHVAHGGRARHVRCVRDRPALIARQTTHPGHARADEGRVGQSARHTAATRTSRQACQCFYATLQTISQLSNTHSTSFCVRAKWSNLFRRSTSKNTWEIRKLVHWMRFDKSELYNRCYRTFFAVCWTIVFTFFLRWDSEACNYTMNVWLTCFHTL